eukprot:CAMPEP_0119325650 /NCGR_PEP_ID=MMETSP1333-20130426/66381_1 /TAXON_ID=418940 /ORGANISM="Scyphosphaera apsteinii, Strain RCC1455" /LENGTH=109 /DNA_ID=CAMNT_0007333695 /DNA_START=83 /DNA_END=412 /DNA_ORIENTATION=-
MKQIPENKRRKANVGKQTLESTQSKANLGYLNVGSKPRKPTAEDFAGKQMIQQMPESDCQKAIKLENKPGKRNAGNQPLDSNPRKQTLESKKANTRKYMHRMMSELIYM